MRESAKIVKKCRGCEAKFTSYKKAAKKFCSFGCYSEWVSRTATRPKPGRWSPPERRRAAYVKVKCRVCGKEFEKRASSCKKLCSPKCRNEHLRACLKKMHERRNRNGKGWSRKYAACVECGRTKYSHHAKGLCEQCRGRLVARQRKGIADSACKICGERRIVHACHIIPEAIGGTLEDGSFHLCPLHHALFDTNDLYESEWVIISSSVHAAFDARGLITAEHRFLKRKFKGL